jgi:hypothetical protein
VHPGTDHRAAGSAFSRVWQDIGKRFLDGSGHHNGVRSGRHEGRSTTNWVRRVARLFLLSPPTPSPRIDSPNDGLAAGLDGHAFDDHPLRHALAAAVIERFEKLREGAHGLE